MKNNGTKTFETERLILRPFKEGDAKDMFKNYTNSELVTEFLTWKPHGELKNTENYLKFVVLPEYSKNNTYRWAVVLKEINEVIGVIDVVRSKETHFKAELGWVIGDKFWGRGIMPEAGKIVLKYLFEEGYKRIEAVHDVRNGKSGRVMEKIGMTYEGRLKKYEVNNEGKLVDCDIYAIVSEE